MNYSFKIHGKETAVYKCYGHDNIWIATIRHYNDEEAVEKLLKHYKDIVLIITKNNQIIYKPKK